MLKSWPTVYFLFPDLQISKQGGPIEVTNEEQIMTVAISFTSPFLRIPDVLLVARPIYLSEDPTLPHDTKFHPDRKVKYELSRLFPLSLVKISVHNAENQQLRFKLASGRTFYLQLCPKSDREEYLFDSWIRVIRLLWPPSEIKSEKKEKSIKTSSLRRSPSPKLKTPSPKCVAEKTTAGSKLTITKSPKGKKTKKKPKKKAKAPASMGKDQDPAPPARTKQKAELVSPPPPPQAREVTEAPKEELADKSPSRKSRAGKEGRRESSPNTNRRAIKESQSRSGQEAATRKPSKLLSLMRSCLWANPKKKSQGARSQSKKKKRSAK
ncbi:UNVERIFIED_CONTAM: hypothetical protein K2H54_018009 [Gekko kuhli]